jgi:putative oxidoreductase
MSMKIESGSLPLPRLARWAALPPRLLVGYGLVAHGYAKLVKGPVHFVEMVRALGVPAPELLGRATIGIELAGGMAILVGAFLPWVSIPIAAVLLVAMFTTHLPYGFSSIKLQAVTAAGAHFGQPGYEVDLLYLACLAGLVLGGAGPYSVDNWLRSRQARGVRQ